MRNSTALDRSSQNVPRNATCESGLRASPPLSQAGSNIAKCSDTLSELTTERSPGNGGRSGMWEGEAPAQPFVFMTSMARQELHPLYVAVPVSKML
jgi:hypothetical protein